MNGVLPVPEAAKQETETRSPKWGWVEATVWNARMLAALDNGVKGGRPNAFFAQQGLFTMDRAHARASQSR